MNNLTDAGIIIASFIIGCSLMFAAGKDLTAWTFVMLGGYFFYRTVTAPEVPEEPED